MNLLDQAAVDARAFLTDVDGGFAQVITVWDPFGDKADLKGFARRVSQAIDPQTGIMVSADITSVSLPIAALREKWPSTLPVGVNDNSPPWLVAFADQGGPLTKFKVRETAPDQTLGVLVCFLEQWDG